MTIDCPDDKHCSVLVWWAGVQSDDDPILIHSIRHHPLPRRSQWAFPALSAKLADE